MKVFLLLIAQIYAASVPTMFNNCIACSLANNYYCASGLIYKDSCDTTSFSSLVCSTQYAPSTSISSECFNQYQSIDSI